MAPETRREAYIYELNRSSKNTLLKEAVEDDGSLSARSDLTHGKSQRQRDSAIVIERARVDNEATAVQGGEIEQALITKRVL
jgi:hypothetical protein